MAFSKWNPGKSRRGVFGIYSLYPFSFGSFYSYTLINLKVFKNSCISKRLYYRTKLSKRQKVKLTKVFILIVLYVLYTGFVANYPCTMHSDAENPKNSYFHGIENSWLDFIWERKIEGVLLEQVFYKTSFITHSSPFSLYIYLIIIKLYEVLHHQLKCWLSSI